MGVIPFANSPAVPAQSTFWSARVQIMIYIILQLKKATTKPKALPAVSNLVSLSIYPHARRRSTISRKNKSRNNTQEERMAAIVKITVSINQAQRYMARALENWALSSPVLASVYAAKIPDPGR
jgi:hypothetical protein